TDCAGGFHALVADAAVARLAAEHGLTARHVAPGPHAAALVGRAVGEAGGAGGSRGAEGSRGAGAAAARFLDDLADRIAVGAASVVAVLDPGCVVLGGEIGQAGGAALAARVEERLVRLSPLPTEVRASALGGDAVVRGALLTARDAAQDELFGAPPGGQGPGGDPAAGQGPSSPPPGRSEGAAAIHDRRP
ncbi:ROK family protein, partial [Streptomyces sp. CRN 30]|uniref:ROK family protein n=1 Tax=Streptomyces sp. CRN 30 TaxID=3075613 RepID=UPI002A8256A8